MCVCVHRDKLLAAVAVAVAVMAAGAAAVVSVEAHVMAAS